MCSHFRTSLGDLRVSLIRATVVASWMRHTPPRESRIFLVIISAVAPGRQSIVLRDDYYIADAKNECCSAKAIWDFEGIFCTSRHIPHVKFAGLIHPGILGCAPSPEVLATWNKREGELISANKLERDVALPPQPISVHAGNADEEIKTKVGKEGARTIPGRPEHGGNCE